MKQNLLMCLCLKELLTIIQGQIPELHISSRTNEVATTFSLQCEVNINDVITFSLNGSSKGFCLAPFLGPKECTPKEITQNLSTALTSWTILSAEPAHNGVWKCARGTSDSLEYDVTIYKLPNETLAETGILSNIVVNQTNSYHLSIEVGCLFSRNGPSTELHFVEIGAASASAFVRMSCIASSTNCSTCKGCSAYSCSHVLSHNQELTSGDVALGTLHGLQITVGVIGTTETFSTSVFPSFTVMFQSTTKTSQTSTGLSAGEVAGIALGSVGIAGIAVGTAVAFKTFTRTKGKADKDLERPTESADRKKNSL